MMRKCAECGWEYDESEYALDEDADGNALVPYHGYAGRLFSLLVKAGPKKASCRGSRQRPDDGLTKEVKP